MSLLDIARDTLKDLPVSDIVRERLSLALDRLAESESKIEALQSEKANFQAQLEIERLDHKKTCEELQRLKDECFEEVCIHHTIEFRRGKRTRGKWLPFCPKCHMPAGMTFKHGAMVGCTAGCGWVTNENVCHLEEIGREL